MHENTLFIFLSDVLSGVCSSSGSSFRYNPGLELGHAIQQKAKM